MVSGKCGHLLIPSYIWYFSPQLQFWSLDIYQIKKDRRLFVQTPGIFKLILNKNVKIIYIKLNYYMIPTIQQQDSITVNTPKAKSQWCQLNNFVDKHDSFWASRP